MEKQKRIPKRRFREFLEAGEWEEDKLHEIASLHARIGWQNLRTDEFLDKGDFYLITGTDFHDGTVDFSTCHYVEQARFLQDSKIQVHDNDILITKDGTLGKVAFVEGMDKPGTLNAGVFVVRTTVDNINIRFLYQYLAAPFLMDYTENVATGGTIKHLNQGVLTNFPVKHPSSAEEQKKIGDFCRRLDTLIALHQQKLSKLKNLKQAYLTEMFPAPGEKLPRRRFKGFSGDWDKIKVYKICSISTGKSNTQDNAKNGQYPFFVRSPIVERSDKYLFDEEAVLTVGDGVGTGKVFHYVNGKYDLHQRVYRMYDFHKDINAKYFYHFFSNFFYNRVMSMTAKTSVDSVRMEMISDMDIIHPSLEEQIRISNLFDSVGNVIEKEVIKISKLQSLKQAYLSELFV